MRRQLRTDDIVPCMSDRNAIAELKFLIQHRGYCKTRDELKSEIHKEYINCKNTSEVENDV